jgi:hypothetical protein
MAQSDAGPLVFLGSYNNYEVLPHWPHGSEGEGLFVCRWVEGKLQVLHKVTNALNPAFMK